jgi:hypothetical protein
MTIAASEKASRFVFGIRTPDFHFCDRCGIVPAVTKQIDGQLYAVVIITDFENVDRQFFRYAPVSLNAVAESDDWSVKSETGLPALIQ